MLETRERIFAIIKGKKKRLMMGNFMILEFLNFINLFIFKKFIRKNLVGSN